MICVVDTASLNDSHVYVGGVGGLLPRLKNGGITDLACVFSINNSNRCGFVLFII
jgi:hypothetical protein